MKLRIAYEFSVWQGVGKRLVLSESEYVVCRAPSRVIGRTGLSRNLGNSAGLMTYRKRLAECLFMIEVVALAVDLE